MLEDLLYYKPGDKEEFITYATIFTTGIFKLTLNKRIYFQVSFPKRLDKISEIKLTFEIFQVRIGPLALTYKILDNSKNPIVIEDFLFQISSKDVNNVFFRTEFNGKEDALTTLLDGNDPDNLHGYLELSSPTFYFN